MAHSGPIGVFDSGIGGLSVARHICARLPNEHLIYFADSANNPYGDKPESFIIGRSFRITEFLLSKGVKALVVACNTATASAIHLLREHFKDLPIVGVEPGLKPASFKTVTSIVGVLNQLLSQQSGVTFILQPCPGLADLIEREDPDSPEIKASVKKYLTPLLEQKADTIVLGCTHYPFVQDTIKQLASEMGHPELMVIDTGDAIARQLENVLRSHGLLNTDTDTENSKNLAIYTSGNANTTALMTQKLLAKEIPVKEAHF